MSQYTLKEITELWESKLELFGVRLEIKGKKDAEYLQIIDEATHQKMKIEGKILLSKVSEQGLEQVLGIYTEFLKIGNKF